MIYFGLLISLDLLSLLVASRFVGAINVVFLVLFCGVFGIWLIANQGWMSLRRLQIERPETAVGRSLLMIIAGFLFIVPGLFSDMLAILFLFPPTAVLISKYLQYRLVRSGGKFAFMGFDRASRGFRSYGQHNTSQHQEGFYQEYTIFEEAGPRPVRDVTPPSETNDSVRHIPANHRDC